jgi:phosphatidate cytidylyltransferase
MPVRLISAAVAIPIGIVLIYGRFFNGLPLLLAVIFTMIVIAYEMSRMADRRGYRLYVWLISVFTTLSIVSFYVFGLGVIDFGYFYLVQLALAMVYTVIVLFLESFSGKYTESLQNIGVSVFTYMMLGMAGPMILLLKMMDQTGWILGMLLLFCWIPDAGGLVIGKFFGKHRLPQLSSPNKTVEGFVGAVLFGAVTAVILYYIQKVFGMATRLNPLQMTFLAGVTIFVSIIGDLGESAIKRWAGVKDSGDIMPGHGGLFDRFDSVLFSAPIFYVILKFFGY